MAVYVYRDDTGALVSWCPGDDDPVASASDLAAAGLTAVSGLAPLDGTHAWDPATKTIIAATVPAPSGIMGTAQWILRFTPTEFMALSQSTDPQTVQFMYALNHTTQIDVTSPLIQGGVAYIVNLKLLDPSRSAAILALPTTSGT